MKRLAAISLSLCALACVTTKEEGEKMRARIDVLEKDLKAEKEASSTDRQKLEAQQAAKLREMQDAMDRLNRTLAHTMQVRIGLHAGSVVAGIIGERKFAYDLWGDTVNTASRLESHGEAGRIHCSQVLYESVKNDFDFEERGTIEIRGKGSMQTYFLIGTRHEKSREFGADSTTSAKPA